MKMIFLLLVLGVNAWAVATNDVPSAPAQRQMFMAASAYQQQGRYVEAAALLKQLAVWQPNDASIVKALAEVEAKQKAKEADPVNVLKRRLAETVLPEVVFRDAAAQDVMQYIQAQADINVVWLVPANVAVSPVTLTLKKVPVGDLLNFVTQLTGLKYRVEPHAVVIFKPDATNAKPE